MAGEPETLDLRGLKCPLPALFAKRALVRAAAGSIVDVIADDPLAALDIPHMCRQEGYEVLSVARGNDSVSRMRLRKPPAQ